MVSLALYKNFRVEKPKQKRSSPYHIYKHLALGLCSVITSLLCVAWAYQKHCPCKHNAAVLRCPAGWPLLGTHCALGTIVLANMCKECFRDYDGRRGVRGERYAKTSEEVEVSFPF